MGIKKVKGIWLKKDEEALEASVKPKQIKTRGVRKAALPSCKSINLSTINETSLEKSLEEESDSTIGPAPQQFVDLEFSYEGETTAAPKAINTAQPAHTLLFELEEDDEPAVKPSKP